MERGIGRSNLHRMYFSPSGETCPNSHVIGGIFRPADTTDSSCHPKVPMVTTMETKDSRLNILSQVLDAAALRHRVIAQNVANVNTPGYRRLAVEFEADLAKALAAPGGAATAHVQPRVVVADGPERVDGNTVDIDREMNDLGRNAVLYEAAVQIITSRVASLRSAIAGR